MSIAKVTTLPPTPDLKVSIRIREDESIMMSGVTDQSGKWQHQHDFALDTPITLVLENEEREVIRCRVQLGAINPMDCLLVEKPARTHDEMHKAWRAAYRRQKARGVAAPDPDKVATEAFKY